MEQQRITIRKMTKDDLDCVVNIEKECFSTPWSKQSLEETLQYESNQFLVAQVNEMIVGYMGLISVGVEADVTNIAVLPNMRNQGIASVLLKTMLKQVKAFGVEVVFLEVRQSNECAIHIYKKYGFVPITTRKQYYQNPVEDAIVMSADLSTMKSESYVL